MILIFISRYNELNLSLKERLTVYMYILDQSNPFEAQTTAFSYRDTQIVQEYSQLFEYFLEMADKCSIINLNEHLLENSSLNVLRHRLLNGKMHFHFQLGNAERQFIRTLMNHEIQCTFEKNQTVIALFDEHILFFEKTPFTCQFIETSQVPATYELIEEKPAHFVLQSAQPAKLLQRLAEQLFDETALLPLQTIHLEKGPHLLDFDLQRPFEIRIQTTKTVAELTQILTQAMLTYYEKN